MKKTYKHPALFVTRIETQLLIAQSPTPNVVVDPDDEGVDAGDVEVKGNSRYNVWNDDWSK